MSGSFDLLAPRKPRERENASDGAASFAGTARDDLIELALPNDRAASPRSCDERSRRGPAARIVHPKGATRTRATQNWTDNVHPARSPAASNQSVTRATVL